MTALLLAGAVAALAVLAFMSGSEAGVYALNRVRLRGRLATGDRRASVLAALVGDLPRLVATVVAGRTVAQAILSFAVTLALEEELPSGAQVLSVVLVAPFALLLGELVPKELFRRHADLLMTAAAPLLVAVQGLLAPLVGLLEAAPRALRSVGLVWTLDARTRATEELATLLASSERDGSISPVAAAVARSALALRTEPVRVALVPLEAVAAVGARETVAAARLVAAKAGKRVLLVHEGRVEQPTGAVAADELFFEPDATRLVRGLTRPVASFASDESLDVALERLARDPLDPVAGFGIVRGLGGRALGIVSHGGLARRVLFMRGRGG